MPARGRWRATRCPASRRREGLLSVSRPFARVFLIVLDGVGCGALPDAAAYGDEGSDTIGHIARQVPLRVPHLRSLGLAAAAGLGGAPAAPQGAYGRMAEASPGKDSVTGHWELMGLVRDRPFPTFPSGFPPAVVAAIERRIGCRLIGNIAASGTEILDRLGADHLDTGRPILYTSADSVLQIAAHEAVVPRAALYRMCEDAFDIVSRDPGIGRVIARPFTGEPGAFRRTGGRRDFALPPPGETLLDRVAAHGLPVTAIGKVEDLFAGRGITEAIRTASDEAGMAQVAERAGRADDGLVCATLVDFDTVYGHRNDVAGFAAHLEWFDDRLGALLPQLGARDLLVVTADHGNDPTTPGTDHAREYVPVLAAGRGVRPVDLGTRPTFADLGQTVAAALAVGPLAHGTSFLEALVGEYS